jgi:3-methylfumaryl-CoA hydratase
MTSIDMSAVKQWIGRSREAEEVIAPRLVEAYRATLAPHLAPVEAGDAPLALHWCLAPELAPTGALGPDGHSLGSGFLPPLPLPRRMWAGGEVETLAPLRLGDRVIRRSVIADISLKEGRSGPLCFVTVHHELATGRGLAIRERQDLVYRAAIAAGAGPVASSSATPADEAPRQADLTWRVDATPVLLFRYSALTFNGHRIHYDHPYATGVEGYPGLLVHGPLQATLLLNLAASLGGRAPHRFNYRAVSPLVAGRPFDLRALRDSAGAVECWSADMAGSIAMKATAKW